MYYTGEKEGLQGKETESRDKFSQVGLPRWGLCFCGVLFILNMHKYLEKEVSHV